MDPRQERVSAARAVRVAISDDPGRQPGLPSSFLEVRVAAGRVEVTEFHSRGGAAALRRALEALGVLVVKEDFRSPCG